MATCGQEQHRNLVARGPDRLQDAPAVYIRQHDIENDQVVGFRHGHVVTIEPGACQVDDKPCFHKALTNVVRRLVLVFDNQQFHRCFTHAAPGHS